MSNLESLDMIKRFLLSRADSNENASLLVDLLDYDRDIDAVILDDIQTQSAKDILEYGNLSFYLLNINNHQIVLYPTDERDKYMSVKDFFDYGQEIIFKSSFSYSEALAIKEFLNEANVKYFSKTIDDGNICFGISKDDEYILDAAIDLMKKEQHSSIGEKHYIYQNLCFANINEHINQLVCGNAISFVGNVIGTCCMKVDESGALFVSAKKPCIYISKNEPDFQNKILNILVTDMQGDREPLKFIFGDFAKDLTTDISIDNIGDTYVSKDEALKILGLKNIPTINDIGLMVNDMDNYSNKKKSALLTIMRMAICSNIKLEDSKDLKFTKEEKTSYRIMHKKNIKTMSSYNKNRTNIRFKDRGGIER